MTRTSLKTVLATAAITLAGAAFAQGTPPNPNVANPATGAGQQTQQGTSMGTTGVPTASPGTATQGSMSTPAPMPSTNMSNDTAAPRMRTARADRN